MPRGAKRRTDQLEQWRLRDAPGAASPMSAHAVQSLEQRARKEQLYLHARSVRVACDKWLRERGVV